MNRAQLFQDFLKENSALGDAAFVAKHPYPFLLGEGIDSGHPDAAATDASALPGSTLKFSRESILAKSPLEAMAIEPGFVLPVAPRHGSKLTIVTVGRGEECDLRLVHPHVSQRHAFLQFRENVWWLVDGGSTNGTYVGGHKVEPKKPQRLTDSEAIRFGPAIRYRFFETLTFKSYLKVHEHMTRRAPKPRAAANPLTRGIEKGGDTPSDVYDQALDAFDR